MTRGGKTFVEALKPGDTVCVSRGGYGRPVYDRREVVKVTPTGRIMTSNGQVFNPDGRERGKRRHGGYGSPSRLVEANENVIAEALRVEAREALRAEVRQWEEWPTGRMEAVLEFLRGLKKDVNGETTT